MTTPLLEVIRHAYPQATITYVAGTYSKVVPEHHPAVNTVIDSGTVGIPGRYSFYDYMKLANVLRRHHFDLAFVLDRSPMLTLLPWLAGVPRRVGPDSLGRGFSLTDRVPVSASPTQLQHQATIYLDLARSIGLPINNPRMCFEPTQEERSDVVGALSEAATQSGGLCVNPFAPLGQGEANITQHEPSDAVGADLSCPASQRSEAERVSILRPTEHDDLVGPQFIAPVGQGEAYTIHTRVAVFPGGGSNPGMELTAKRWPLERYRELVRRLVREFDAEVLLIGGPEDIDLNQCLLEGLDVPVGTITNLAGKTTIGQLAAHLEQCALFIGNDSSPMHLAAAVGIPVIAIFGPTSPQEYGPYPLDDPKHIAIWHHPTGQPCFFLGKMQTCTACTCMQSVTVDEVWDAVRLFLPAQLPETQ